jgi:hyperosmotically inducible periplasmic protein
VPSVVQALNQWRAVLGGVQIVRSFTGGKTMKVDYKNIIRTFLCIGLLLGVGVLTHAQEPNNQAPPASDNTKTNQRDRSANEPTADQQRDNRSDRDITQQIRRAIMNDKSLSTYAHNVKVITQQGQVTLKGPVQSEDEKKSIEAKAAEVVGENKVSSELNVKPQQ